MRKLFTLCLLVFTLSASAQWQQTGSKVRYVNGLGIPTKDTAAGVAADSSQIVIRPADSSLYVKYKRTWVKVGGGTVSGTINRVPKFTGATTLGNSSIVDSASSVAMTINPSGDVGIGITNPIQKLDLRGASGVGLQIYETSTGNDNRFILSQIGTESRFTSTFNTGSGLYTWYIGGGELMRLTSSGNLGINQNAPAGRFVVADGQTLLGTNTNNGVDRLQVSGSAIASTLKFNTSGQTVTISSYYNAGAGKNIWIGGGGASSTSASIYNVSLGFDAMLNNTSGNSNVAIGVEALKLNTSGIYNLAIGSSALLSNLTGNYNVAIGASSLATNTGSFNTSIGSNSLAFNTSGNNNVSIGDAAMFWNSTGSSNVALGQEAGRRISGGGNNATSSQCILIGQDTRTSADGNTNEMVFGHTAIGQGSNTVTLGNSSITKTFLRGNTMVNTTTDNGVDELQVNGSISGIGFKQAYVTKTGAYTATNDDYVIDCTSGTFTVTLPASSGRTGRILIIKNSGAGTITVDGNAAETIDGAATYSIAVQYGTIQIMSDGTNWKIIAKF